MRDDPAFVDISFTHTHTHTHTHKIQKTGSTGLCGDSFPKKNRFILCILEQPAAVNGEESLSVYNIYGHGCTTYLRRKCDSNVALYITADVL